ncbi:MAG: TIGR00725 family protein [Chloroflexi bacterium]|nr:TIGR00725 family protein [Chloroflexota bacterium]
MLFAIGGAGECDAEMARLAEEVGWGLAKAGAVLITGGLGGVMEAACKGAKRAGGMTIGILPGSSRREANEYVDIPLVTGLGHARNVIVAGSADVFIAVGGEYGTLSEIALALKMGVPVIGLRTWELGKLGKPCEDIHVAHTPEEAVKEACRLAKSRTKGVSRPTQPPE